MKGEAARGSPARDAEQGQDQSGDGPGKKRGEPDIFRAGKTLRADS